MRIKNKVDRHILPNKTIFCCVIIISASLETMPIVKPCGILTMNFSLIW